jgi:hypothetical protein
MGCADELEDASFDYVDLRTKPLLGKAVVMFSDEFRELKIDAREGARLMWQEGLEHGGEAALI